MSKSYPEFYARISAPWRRNPEMAKLVERADAFLRVAVAGAYAGLLAWLAATSSGQLLRAFVVPLVTFGLVTAMRAFVNARRPYEAHDIAPLIHKDTQGKSMPSRHMASATIIACTLLWAAGLLCGTLGFAACGAIAYLRIVGGVHYPRDIVAGAGFALLCALLGYVAIP
ncbi:MAG: phosphatase PAP2 family protein [Eggerthellaceae bacterium]|nr:phosphatase PAP2 family protein [Eggerthellaceae bacterium]